MDHLCLLPLEGPLKWSRGTGQEKSPVWQAMASWSIPPGECLETFQMCWRWAFLSVLPSFSSVSAKISLEVHRGWRAHCPGLCCLSLALIATCVLSYVVIALILAFVDRLLCATVRRDLRTLPHWSCYNPVKFCYPRFTNGKTEVWTAVTYPQGYV